MKTEGRSGSSRTEVFGAAFAALMHRLDEAYDSLIEPGDGFHERRRVRREVADRFEDECESLMAQHGVTNPIAAYVRHVVREGFDADFDAMDPSNEALEPHAQAVVADDWTSSPPTRPGVYAVRNPSGGGAELASFDLRGGRCFVRRWGVAGAEEWGQLGGGSWERWPALVQVPGERSPLV